MLRRGRSNDRVDLAASAASIFAFLAPHSSAQFFFLPPTLFKNHMTPWLPCLLSDGPAGSALATWEDAIAGECLRSRPSIFLHVVVLMMPPSALCFSSKSLSLHLCLPSKSPASALVPTLAST